MPVEEPSERTSQKRYCDGNKKKKREEKTEESRTAFSPLFEAEDHRGEVPQVGHFVFEESSMEGEDAMQYLLKNRRTSE